MFKKNKILFLLLLGLIIRLILIFTTDFHADVYNHIDWGMKLARIGPNNFYNPNIIWAHSQPNQPILTMYLFTGVFYVYKYLMTFIYFLNKFPIFPSKFIWFAELHLHSILLKVPFVLADIGISYLLYLLIKNKKLALILASLFLFNPALIYNSSVWGQTDSLLNLLFLICLYLYTKKKYNLSIFFLISCFLFKMSLFIFIPIMFFYFISLKPKNYIKGLIWGIVLVLILSLPFSWPNNPITWLYWLYSNRVFSNQGNMLNGNALNLWFLYMKKIDICLQATAIQKYLSVGFFSLIFLLIYLKKKFNLFYALFLVAFWSFLVMFNMHERYLYPIFPLFIILISIYPKIFKIRDFIIITLIHWLNLYNQWWYPRIPSLQIFMETNHYLFLKILTYALLVYFIYYLINFLKNENK